MNSRIVVILLYMSLRASLANGQVCHVHDAPVQFAQSPFSTWVPHTNRSFPLDVGVAFHIIHTGGEENITRDALEKQIDVLNAGFNGTGFSFYLALVTRTQNPSWFVLPEVGLPSSEIREALLVAPTRMVNVFVGDMRNQAMGWSVFADTNDPESHAIAIDYVSLPGGPFDPDFDTGVTLVHEMGHYMGLRHPFERGCLADPTKGDFVADTPASSEVWFRQCPLMADSCPTIPGDDPVRNFMHLTTDACRIAWTPGQIDRMEALVNQFRPDLGSSVLDLEKDITIDAESAWYFYEGTYRFPPGARLVVEGVLEARTTTFTSHSSAWGGIRFTPGSEGVLQQVELTGISGGAGQAGLTVQGAEVMLDGVLIDIEAGSHVFGVRVFGVQAFGPDQLVTIKNSTIRSASAEALHVSGRQSLLFLHNTHLIQESARAAVNVSQGGSVHFWGGPEAPYVGRNRIEGGGLLATEGGFIHAGIALNDRSQNHFCDAQSAQLETRTGGTIYATHNYWATPPSIRGMNITFGESRGIAACEASTAPSRAAPSEALSAALNLRNHPNPFNPTTTLSFELPAAGRVQLIVYDMLGRPVETLIDGFREAGGHQVTFNASDLSSGSYMYRLVTEQGVSTRVMVVVN